MKKTKYLFLILMMYVVSFGLSAFLTYLMKIDDTLLKVFIFDIMATVFVFIFSVICGNSSVYDPYWSVLPIIVSIYLLVHYKAYTAYHIITLVAIIIWGLRLTINWINTTSGFDYEDWRYRHLREKSNGNKFVWFILNFFGIHLVPTLFVFFGMLPMFVIFKEESLNLLSMIGVATILLGIALELISDIDIHRFLRNTKEKKVCREGLWDFSRHPNYLGEITVWLGIYLTMILTTTECFYYFVGVVGMIFMFNVISIPMMERRQIKRRSDYPLYIQEVSRLLLLPHKKR